MGVVHIFANLTSRSPLRMTELRKLWFVLDSHGIFIRARYIKTTANMWADRPSREIDYDDWAAFNLRHFNHLDNIWEDKVVDHLKLNKNGEFKCKEKARKAEVAKRSFVASMEGDEIRRAYLAESPNLMP
eukprot:jgi/Tetstr1/433355/TSEL_022641.t1